MTSRRGRALSLVVALGVVDWLGFAWLAARLFATDPPTAGFDLEILLRAGRAVASGQSPYDPAMLSGVAPAAERLFYSYPPIVAQATSLLSAVPSGIVLAGWIAASVAGLALVTRALVWRLAPDEDGTVVVAVVVALAPLMFPYAIGLLFGNLDVFFPTLYGALLLAVVPGPTRTALAATRATQVAGGAGAAIAAVSKLHPGSLFVWLLVRARDPATRRVLAWAVAIAIAVLLASLAVGGIGPWLDYATVVRVGSGADLVDPRNAGPAAQIALLASGSTAAGEALARILQFAVTLGALAVSVAAAWRFRDPLESLAWATTASLVILPVTWYHYPSALIPFAIAAVLRTRGVRPARRVVGLVATAAVVAAIAIAWLPLLAVAVGLILAAVHVSRATDERAERDGSPAPAGDLTIPAS